METSPPPDSPSVLFIGEDGISSQRHYRCDQPAQALIHAGWRAGVASVLFSRNDNRLVGIKHGRMMFADHVVTRRLTNQEGKVEETGDMIELARIAGQKVFYDLDDDIWNIPKWSPAYREGEEAEHNLAVWQHDMEACNGVLVTTPALAEAVRAHTKASNVFVCPNGVDRFSFERRRNIHVPFRLGWPGTTKYRMADLSIAVDGLRSALAGYRGAVEFWHLGANPDNPHVSSILGADFPVEIVERQYVPIGELPMLLNQVDAAILPMVSHPFNESRSNITGLAFAAAGVPFAASMTRPYEELWRKGVGYNVLDDNWEHGVRIMTEPHYAQVRADMEISGLALIPQYSPDVLIKHWIEAFHADTA